MASEVLNFYGKGQVLQGNASVTVSALAAGAEEELTITDTRVASTDIAMGASFTYSDWETGLSISHIAVSAADTIKVSISNQSGSSLTGGSFNLNYFIYSESTDNR